MKNNFTHPVIQADGRDNKTSWNNHIKRGSIGGVDLAYPYGTPVHAVANGSVVYTTGNGSGGYMALLTTTLGVIVEYLHLSKYAGKNRMVKTGDVIAYSGGSGYGKPTYYAPHLHVHAVKSGRRVNVFDLFTDDTWAVNIHLADQTRVQHALTGMNRYSGPIDGLIGAAGYKGLQTTAAKVGYDGPIDGVLGERSVYFLQVYAKAFGDYSGPTDGVMGANSWAGVSLGLERK